MMNVVDPSPSSDTTMARTAVPTTRRIGIVADDPQNQPDQRIEQADVDHDPEVDDREEQQRGRRRHSLHAVGDHVADAQPRAGQRDRTQPGLRSSRPRGWPVST